MSEETNTAATAISSAGRGVSEGKGSEPIVWFDPGRRAASRVFKEAIKRVSAQLESYEASNSHRRRRSLSESRKLALAAEAVICNIVAKELLSPGAALAVPRSSGVMWGRGRSTSPVYGKHFLDALDLMESQGLITSTKGWRLSEEKRKASTISATPRLFECIGLPAFSWDNLMRLEDSEVIVLKAPKSGSTAGKRLQYKDNRRIIALRRQVQRLNRALQEADISIIDNRCGDETENIRVDPTRRTVVRHFNNGIWTQGGRLFGGFWMSMPREERFRRLRIDGEQVANVDFGQLFPRLAYVLAGVEQPKGDLYSIGLDDAVADPKMLRKGVKKLFNALLFETKRFTRWPRDTSHLFQGVKLREAIRAIETAHQPIENMFGKGVGYRLLYTESSILMGVLEIVFAEGITALPLHDSVLVDRPQAARAKEVMEGEFERATGESGGMVSIELHE